MGFQPNHGLVHAKIGDLRSGMPSCSAGQFIALEQHNIAPALLRQMIERRAPGNAAANDHHFGS